MLKIVKYQLILDKLILEWMDHTKNKREKSYHQQKINVNDEVHKEYKYRDRPKQQ